MTELYLNKNKYSYSYVWDLIIKYKKDISLQNYNITRLKYKLLKHQLKQNKQIKAV